MNNIGAIRDHMKSIKQTVKISSAQKLIAGARIVKARKLFEQSKSYHDRIQRVVASVLGECTTKSKYLIYGPQDFKKRGLLVISADRGLAGGYNQNIVKLVMQTAKEKPIVKLLAAGHAGYRKFARLRVPLVTDFTYAVENPTMHQARKMSDRMVALFESGEVDCFDVVYTHFYTSAHMTPVVERLFPLSPEGQGEPLPRIPEYEPSPDAVLEALIPKYIKGYLFGCLVQAWTCELNSRVAAMESAIKNGNEMLEKLSLQYNRARQGAITQEITEIVAGASSMETEEDISV
jgi:F-type H+-transporting ATPase subunit gamma